MLMLWPHLRPIKSEFQLFKIFNTQQPVWRNFDLQNPWGLNPGFSAIPLPSKFFLMKEPKFLMLLFLLYLPEVIDP